MIKGLILIKKKKFQITDSFGIVTEKILIINHIKICIEIY
jgi:hypothetical protein